MNSFYRKMQQRVGSAVLVLTFTLTIGALSVGAAAARDLVDRTMPSRILPVPDTVSPQLRNAIGQPPAPSLQFPKTAEEWKVLTARDPGIAEYVSKRADKLRVTVAAQVIGGVPCYTVTPKALKPENIHRALLGLHHGGWVFAAGDSGLDEAMVMASATGIKVIAVDYSMLPEHPFPAAMDEVLTVWKELIRSTKPNRIAVFGSSVGGSMALSLVQRAKKEGLPLPGAVMSGTPWSDMSKTGDSYYTNDGVDGTLRYDGFWESVAKLYAEGRDLKDPQLSPVYGDFTGFPPTVLITGTRDLFLSNTVRVHHKLRLAGVESQLIVEEAQPHMGYLVAAMVGAPEGAQLYSQVARFFDAHLGR